MKLVLLPGMDGTGRLFRRFVNELNKLGHESMVISYPTDCLWGYEEIEAYVRASLPNNEAYVVLAESFSGPVGLRLAAFPPSGMQGLILSCTFARISSPVLRGLASVGRFFSARWIPQFVMGRLLYGRHATPELMRELVLALRMAPDTVLKHRLSDVMRIDVTDSIEKIEMPVLHLQAKEDRVIGSENSLWLAAHIKSMQVRQFAGPHLLLQSCSKEAAKEVSLFVHWVFRAVAKV
jgi:pimeloyl-ACP methyl ester carboxylesterase